LLIVKSTPFLLIVKSTPFLLIVMGWDGAT
jgi:hypothetical protein